MVSPDLGAFSTLWTRAEGVQAKSRAAMAETLHIPKGTGHPTPSEPLRRPMDEAKQVRCPLISISEFARIVPEAGMKKLLLIILALAAIVIAVTWLARKLGEHEERVREENRRILQGERP